MIPTLLSPVKTFFRISISSWVLCVCIGYLKANWRLMCLLWISIIPFLIKRHYPPPWLMWFCWLECWPHTKGCQVWFPSQSTYLGCRFNPRSGWVGRQPISVFLFSPLSNQFFKNFNEKALPYITWFFILINHPYTETMSLTFFFSSDYILISSTVLAIAPPNHFPQFVPAFFIIAFWFTFP